MTKKSYHKSGLEHVTAVMLGDPADGKRYRMPVFPGGGVPTAFNTSLQQPRDKPVCGVSSRRRCAGRGPFRVLLRQDRRL